MNTETELLILEQLKEIKTDIEALKNKPKLRKRSRSRSTSDLPKEYVDDTFTVQKNAQYTNEHYAVQKDLLIVLNQVLGYKYVAMTCSNFNESKEILATDICIYNKETEIADIIIIITVQERSYEMCRVESEIEYTKFKEAFSVLVNPVGKFNYEVAEWHKCTPEKGLQEGNSISNILGLDFNELINNLKQNK